MIIEGWQWNIRELLRNVHDDLGLFDLDIRQEQMKSDSALIIIISDFKEILTTYRHIA
jgi:hypothetical protein